MKNSFLIGIIIISFFSCKTPMKNKMPTDPQATHETVALYNRLFNLAEKGIMLGHQDDPLYGHGWYGEQDRSDVKGMIGDYPAIFGFELGHIELDSEYSLDSVYFSQIKKHVKEHHARGGISSFSWHADNIATGNSTWDCAQDTVVRSILPGGSLHKEYLVWLERLANFFLDLKDENGAYIPVIFRMYHEHTGDWFWWSSQQSTPEEYKQLWIMTCNYLQKTKQVHHLLYAYSSSNVQSEEHYLERYPGDQYVDILGFDHYLKGREQKNVEQYKIDFERNIKIVTKCAEQSGKLPVIGETGEESIWDPTYFTNVVYPIINKYKLGWILFWRNAWEPDKPNHYYLPYPGHSSESDFKQFVDQPLILTNKDVYQQ